VEAKVRLKLHEQMILYLVDSVHNWFFDHSNDKYENDDFGVFGRLNFHLQDPLGLPSQWDIYPGVDLGLLGKSGTYFGAHLGVRYFFNNNVGVYLEAGNNGSLGVSFNL